MTLWRGSLLAAPSLLRTPYFPESPDLFLKEVVKELVRQISWAELFVETHDLEEKQVRQCLGIFEKGYWWVSFCTCDHYLHSILKLTVRGPSYLWILTGPSIFEALVFLHGISLVIIIIDTGVLGCYLTYITETMVGYITQTKTKA